MRGLRAAKITFVAFVAVALQIAVAAQLPVHGVIVDLVLVATIAAGLAAGPEAGAGMGFGCGLLIDLQGVGPVGLGALVYTLVGYGVGISQIGVLRTSRLIPLAATVVAALAATFGYAFVGEVLGQGLFTIADVPLVALVVTVGCAVLCLPARRVMAWAFAREDAAWAREVRW